MGECVAVVAVEIDKSAYFGEGEWEVCSFSVMDRPITYWRSGSVDSMSAQS